MNYLEKKQLWEKEKKGDAGEERKKIHFLFELILGSKSPVPLDLWCRSHARL